MPTRAWSHISDYASVLYGVSTIIRDFNRLFLPEIPFVYPVFYVISKWKGTFNEEYTYAVRLTSPSSAVIFTSPVEQVKITGGLDGTEHVSVTQLINTNFPVPGLYRVRLLVNNITVYSMPLEISHSGR
jgi:hypothetical protein